MDGVLAELKARALRGELRADIEHRNGAHPPLDDVVVSAAESELGFRLPEFLRRLYSEIGNGGYGPSYGLLGLNGGMLNKDACDAAALYLDYKQSDPDDSHWCWPEGLLPIGHLGCAMYLCVDCTKPNGPVVLFDPNPHCQGESWDDSFLDFADSTHEWISA